MRRLAMNTMPGLSTNPTELAELFELAPVSLWLEDYSAVRDQLQQWRDAGVMDLGAFLRESPDRVALCSSLIRVVAVNRRTLELFDGELIHHRESVNYTLADERLNVHLQLSVLPGHESDWKMVLVSLMDITARKRAEAYLEYLGTHDPMSKLRNRAFFTEELKRVNKRGPWPVTILVIDLNHLKEANDIQGHATGDALIRRAGEVLSKTGEGDMCAARIGGDEFALLLPATDAAGGHRIEERVAHLVSLNNRFYDGPPLSFAMGMATGGKSASLEDLMTQADARMYDNKRDYYSRTGIDRRTT